MVNNIGKLTGLNYSKISEITIDLRDYNDTDLLIRFIIDGGTIIEKLIPEGLLHEELSFLENLPAYIEFNDENGETPDDIGTTIIDGETKIFTYDSDSSTIDFSHIVLNIKKVIFKRKIKDIVEYDSRYGKTLIEVFSEKGESLFYDDVYLNDVSSQDEAELIDEDFINGLLNNLDKVFNIKLI